MAHSGWPLAIAISDLLLAIGQLIFDLLEKESMGGCGGPCILSVPGIQNLLKLL